MRSRNKEATIKIRSQLLLNGSWVCAVVLLGQTVHAQTANDHPLKVFPKDFALDATHRPQITRVQRFVRTADLDKVCAAVGKVFAGSNVTGLKLEAFEYPSGGRC